MIGAAPRLLRVFPGADQGQADVPVREARERGGGADAAPFASDWLPKEVASHTDHLCVRVGCHQLPHQQLFLPPCVGVRLTDMDSDSDDYERARERQIKENRALLESLGLNVSMQSHRQAGLSSDA